MIFLLIIYLGVFTRSSPKYQLFIYTDWYHKKKANSLISWNSEAFCIIINRQSVGYRSESVLSHPVSVPCNAQKVSDESQLSSLPPLAESSNEKPETPESSTRGCQTVVWTHWLIIQAVNLGVKGSLPHERVSELFTAQRLLFSVYCVENMVTQNTAN